MSEIDNLLSQSTLQGHASIPAHWGQGRTVFGGLTAALLVPEMDRLVEDDKRLLNMNVSFIGPVAVDTSCTPQAEIVRAGGTLTHVRGKLMQNGQPMVEVLAVYGRARVSSLEYDHFKAPDFFAPDHRRAQVLDAGVAPAFMANFNTRIVQGGMPFSGHPDPNFGAWVRFKIPPAKISEAHILCMLDAFPPAGAQHLTEIRPVATVTWSIQFVQPQPNVDPSDYVGYQAQAKWAHGATGFNTAQFWRSDGALLAYSKQTVIIYG